MPSLAPRLSRELFLRLTAAPSAMFSGARQQFGLELENRSGQTLASVSPHPVHIAYRWLDASTNEMVEPEGVRTPLSASVGAGSRHRQSADVTAPLREGRFVLRVTLVQEGVRWFDETVPPVVAEHIVDVTSSGLLEPEGPTGARALHLGAVTQWIPARAL